MPDSEMTTAEKEALIGKTPCPQRDEPMAHTVPEGSDHCIDCGAKVAKGDSV